MTGLILGIRLDRAATRAFTPVAAKLAQNRLTGRLAIAVSHYTGLAALGLGYTSWESGTALTQAARLEDFESFTALTNHYALLDTAGPFAESRAFLHTAHVIGLHFFLSIHVALMSAPVNAPDDVSGASGIGEYLYASPETIAGLIMAYCIGHTAISTHELGHVREAIQQSAWSEGLQKSYEEAQKSRLGLRWWWFKAFLSIPYGKFIGVERRLLDYRVATDGDNLAVNAKGPLTSGKMALAALPLTIGFGAAGLLLGTEAALYLARFFLGLTLIGTGDRFLADMGEVKKFKAYLDSLKAGANKVASADTERMLQLIRQIKTTLPDPNKRPLRVTTPDGRMILFPWQFRNCAQGGRHTEGDFKESNISMQESMYIPLSAKNNEEAQEMIVTLQKALRMRIANLEKGCRVLGNGTEGGLATIIKMEDGDMVPEQRLWRIMTQTIRDCGWEPGQDVAIALDPAASELENAYRESNKDPNSIGRYSFWRHDRNLVLDRDQVVGLYETAIMRDGVPIVSIEDGAGEKDIAGWKLLTERLGGLSRVICDDLETTNDRIVELYASQGIGDTLLVKLNQIGTITEAIIAVLTNYAYKKECVVSHRSQSTIDTFEADFAVAIEALGVKMGGGANSERQEKYERIVEIAALACAERRVISQAEKADILTDLKAIVHQLTGQPIEEIVLADNASEVDLLQLALSMSRVEAIYGKEKATNSGTPTNAATVIISKSPVVFFKSGTPVGASAGITEAVHYVDSMIRPSAVTERYPELFERLMIKNEGGEEVWTGVVTFKEGLDCQKDIRAKHDAALSALWDRAGRYKGKGCLTAAEHIDNILAARFVGRKVSDLGGILGIDRELLSIEREQAIASGSISEKSPWNEQVAAMQKKGVLGMNAILALSLSLGRAAAAIEGRQLWEPIQDLAKAAMAKFIAAQSGGEEAVNWQKLAAESSFSELKLLYQAAAQKIIRAGGEIHSLLRDQLPVYEIVEPVQIGSEVFNLTGFGEEARLRLHQLSRVFVPAGSVPYHAQLVDGKTWLQVDEAARTGLGLHWQSRARDKFYEARDHKGEVFAERSIWVDEVHIGKRGEVFAGYYSVLIPQRATDDQGRIFLLVGKFKEPDQPQQKLQLFADALTEMEKFASRHADLDQSTVTARIRQAFVKIPVAEFFLRAPRELYETHIEPALNGQA